MNIVTISGIAVWIISLTGLIGFMAGRDIPASQRTGYKKSERGFRKGSICFICPRGFFCPDITGHYGRTDRILCTGSHWLNQFAVKVPLCGGYFQ
jgi:hypothetical protein